MKGKASGGIVQDRLAVSQARHLEIQGRQLLPTAFPFRDVLLAQGPTQAHQVDAGISRKEHPATLRPREGKLARTGDGSTEGMNVRLCPRGLFERSKTAEVIGMTLLSECSCSPMQRPPRHKLGYVNGTHAALKRMLPRDRGHKRSRGSR
jgi:hypothetical protein